MTKSTALTGTAQAAENLNVPQGVSGRHRNMYLSLNDTQKRAYRYHFIVCGRLAAHCYEYAAEEN